MKMQFDIPLHTLTKKELEILRYVHDNSALIQTMSIQQFAKNINYSTSTVLRFCRKLGFSGYPELKYYLKNKVTEGIAADSRQIDVTAYAKIKQNIITELEGTGGLLNSESLPAISEYLQKNTIIYLHEPSGITDIPIDYLASTLFIAGFRNIYKTVAKRTTSHLIQTARPGSVFIFISASGSFSDTLVLAKEAAMSGMTVISISSVESNELAEISNCSLRFFTKIRDNNGADLTSRLCIFFVISTMIEYLSSNVTADDQPRTINDRIQLIMPENSSPLSETELLICDYFNEKINMLAQLSVHDIASQLYVSPSSVVRFCQKAGFKGFNEFKFYLKSRNKIDSQSNSLWNVIQHNISIIKDVIETINEEEILNICRMIETCSSFYVYGRNMSSLPARYLHSFMTTIDIPCILIDWIDFLSSLSDSFNQDTLLIMFTNHGDSQTYSQILEKCHRQNVKVVWISSDEIDSELQNSRGIYITTNEGKLQDANLRTKLSSFVIVQLIVEMLIQNRFQ